MTTEEKKVILIDCWKEVFQLEKVTDDMDFFDMGGDSVKALQLTEKLGKRGIKLDIMNIFSVSRLGDMVKVLEEAPAFEDKGGEMNMSRKDASFGFAPQPGLTPQAGTIPQPDMTSQVGVAPQYGSTFGPAPQYVQMPGYIAVPQILSMPQPVDSSQTGQLISQLTAENQTRRILDILDTCQDLTEAKEKVRALLR